MFPCSNSLCKFGFCTITLSIACILWSGCGGGSGNTNDNGGGTISASDCQNLSSDAAVASDDDTGNDLLASAVTSDCDQVAVYSSDNTTVKQVAITTADGDTLIAEYDDNGQVIAVEREGSTESLAVSYNTSLGYARVEDVDESGNSSSSIVVVERSETSGKKRRPFQDNANDNATDSSGNDNSSSDNDNTNASDDGNENDNQDDDADDNGNDNSDLPENTNENEDGDDETDGNDNQNETVDDPTNENDNQATDNSNDDSDDEVTTTGDLDFCDALQQYADLINSACSTDDPPAYCETAIADAANAFEKICSSDNVDSVDDIEDLGLGDNERDVDLTVQGFFTTRPASGSGTTIIFTSISFGGTPPYETEWSQTDGEEVTLTQLPGGAALGDAAINSGDLTFDVTITDADGNSTTDTIAVVFGDDFSGAEIQASNLEPASGEEVTFTAGGNFGSASLFGPAQDSDDSTTDYYWDFGDSSADTGPEVSHTYDQTGCYTVTLVIVSESGDLVANTTISVDGGCDAGASEADFVVEIDAQSDDTMTPGEGRSFSAVISGAVEPVSLSWAISRPDLADLFEEDPSDSAKPDIPEFVFTDSPFLQANGEGILILGVKAVDATGRVTFDLQPLAICGEDTGLLTLILQPFKLDVGTAAPLESYTIDCDGDLGELSYEWRILEDEVSTTDDNASLSDAAAEFPQILANEPGFLVVTLVVTDSEGNTAEAGIGLPVFPQGFGEFCTDGDFFCHLDCEVPDPDCEACVEDGVCIKKCPEPDPDCLAERCRPDDGICDFNCPEPDPDCLAEFCIADDGFCDFPCPPNRPDPDCGGNDDICELNGFCCDDDEFCDRGCPEIDLQCEECSVEDGVCIFDCPEPDPDCLSDGECASGDFVCTPNCEPPDFDCAMCGPGNVCMEGCLLPDPDCDNGFDCAQEDGICRANCPEPDIDCEFCPEDGVCAFDCPTPDLDCGNDDVCDRSGFCCEGDGICNPNCPEPDGDCDTSGDGDTNADICAATRFCCDGDTLCDIDCPEIDSDCL